MISSSLASRHRCLAAILFGAGAFVLAACESFNTGSGVNPSSLGILPQSLARPATLTTCKMGTVLCWKLFSVGPFTTVGGGNTSLTALTEDSKATTFSTTKNVPTCTPTIVGISFATTSEPYSFIAAPNNTACDSTLLGQYTEPSPYPPSPHNKGTHLSGIYGAYTVGYALGNKTIPGCTSNVACGIIYDPGATSAAQQLFQVQHPNSCSTYLYGTSDARIQVGYYTTGTKCVAQAVEEYSPSTSSQQPPFCSSPPFPSSSCGPQFADLRPSGTSSKAFGINVEGDVVGTDTATGGTVSWEFQGLKYAPITTSYPGVSNMQALGISFAGLVVGSYVDSIGTHGFVQNNSDTFTIDFPGSNFTVVNAINTQQEIAGWYKGSNAISNGFVGFCHVSQPSNCPDNKGSSLSMLTGGLGSAMRPRR
jgi:hypothetical protein